ncbi:shikimate kinase AroL [Pseudodesulfovibrio thermohalotolerans]|uniref:shikimate kinase AroL n=1 Tax=Pseudodesulfovibrio thermohalotolerans TaxID=2880651 RepID=UPI0024431DF2|nr:shikimate kinase AroL [Pseudodesulfovibrio thermohalotolerans]WFS61267.1 shikimate kinase AroL [Pseudodesulfovibrio thermohalotolerans]
MHKARNIFLIGPRACGKTSVGRALAKRLGMEFVDTDHAFVEAVGMDIASFVEANGWDAFRDEEARTLEREAASGGRVIGCGGGIVLREENRAVLAGGLTLYLKTGPDELARRLAADPLASQRPSLTGKSLADEVREVLAERAGLYEGCAHHVVEGVDLDGTVERAYGIVKTIFERF